MINIEAVETLKVTEVHGESDFLEVTRTIQINGQVVTSNTKKVHKDRLKFYLGFLRTSMTNEIYRSISSDSPVASSKS